MRHTISKRLAPLASLAAQRRYMVRGTSDEYLLAADLLNDAYDVVRLVDTTPIARDSMPASAVEILLGLKVLLDAVDAEERIASTEHFVEHDAAWGAVRERAGRFLDEVGFDLAAWEVKEGLCGAA